MRLNVSETGSGPALAVLHGLLGSSRNWGGIARILGASRRVLAMDMPNHGASPWMEPFDYPAMAEAVAETLQAAGETRAAVVGHSMGGKAAMTLALTRPEMVERLVVADIAPVKYTHSFRGYVEAMKTAPLATAQRRGDIEDHLAAHVPDPKVRAFLMQNLESKDGGYGWRPNLDVLGRTMAAVMDFPDFGGRRYEGPVLFLTGADSDYVKPEHEGLIRALFPRARFQALAGAGHWLHADQPQAFLQAVQAFLAE